jgi:hypothetical protein
MISMLGGKRLYPSEAVIFRSFASFITASTRTKHQNTT